MYAVYVAGIIYTTALNFISYKNNLRCFGFGQNIFCHCHYIKKKYSNKTLIKKLKLTKNIYNGLIKKIDWRGNLKSIYSEYSGI